MTEVKEGYVVGRKYKYAKEEINGNWYYLLLLPERTKKSPHYFIAIYAHPWSGKEMDVEPHEVTSSNLKEIARFKSRRLDKSFEKQVSETLNEAICKMENKQDKQEEFRIKIESVLEANKEVHEGIDYELELEV